MLVAFSISRSVAHQCVEGADWVEPIFPWLVRKYVACRLFNPVGEKHCRNIMQIGKSFSSCILQCHGASVYSLTSWAENCRTSSISMDVWLRTVLLQTPIVSVLSVIQEQHYSYFHFRFLHHLKGKVGNKACVESSICNAYLMEEITNFVANYFDDKVDTKASDCPEIWSELIKPKQMLLFLQFSLRMSGTPLVKERSDFWIIGIIVLRMRMFFQIVGC